MPVVSAVGPAAAAAAGYGTCYQPQVAAAAEAEAAACRRQFLRCKEEGLVVWFQVKKEQGRTPAAAQQQPAAAGNAIAAV